MTKTQKPRINYVLTHTFDDIKRSPYFNDIVSTWDNLGFTNGFEGEKHDNICIAFDQIASFLLSDFALFSGKITNELYEEVFTDLVGLQKFEFVMFGIVRIVYEKLPLSDYDYQELLSAYASVVISDEEKKEIEESENKDMAFCNKMAEKIIKIINREE